MATFLAVTIPSISASTIFLDDFSGDANNLDGSSPDVRSENWIASSTFNRDGSLDPRPGSATLAFTPVDGKIYLLDVSLREVSGDQNWIALGFSAGQSSAVSTGNRFITNLHIGKAWMLFRGNTNGHQTFLGTAVSGTQNVSPWAEFKSETGDIDMRIELDTTGGAGSWAAPWFAKKPTDESYTQVREQQVLADEAIDSVGIAMANVGIEGRIESFSLSDSTAPTSQLTITNISYSADSRMVTLTWTSSPGEIFAVKYSDDMTNWDNELEDSIDAEDGSITTMTFDITELSADNKLFFRVEKQ